MIGLAIVSCLCLLISWSTDRKKTLAGLKQGLAMFIKILPVLLTMLILVSIALYAVANRQIITWLSQNDGWQAMTAAALLGSIALIPGFIAYPLSAILLQNGVSFRILAVFITTLMMVGVLTLPLEARYFGWKVSILRNALSLMAALLIGLTIGFFL